ncbi:MAG: hypothetical protein ACYTDX_09130, partial [Planctomycetota bacterium]
DTVYFSRDLDHALIAEELEELAIIFKTDESMRGWTMATEGLRLLRKKRFSGAAEIFRTAEALFGHGGSPVKRHWAKVFLAVALFADGQDKKAVETVQVAAEYFNANTSGRVKQCALQCLSTPTAAAICRLARTLVCPWAAAAALAQGQTWGPIIRTG